MSWYAFDALGETYRRSVGVLFAPFDRRFYLKLAVIALLASGFGIGSGPNYSYENSEWTENFHTPYFYLMLAAVFIAAVAIGIVFSVVSSVFGFVFIDTLLEKKASIRRGFERRFWPGVRVFAFKVLLTLAFAFFAGILIAVGILTGLTELEGITYLIVVTVGILIILAVALVAALISSFTGDFVVPLMRSKGLGVFAAWRLLAPKIRANKMQFLAYVAVKIVLGVGGAVFGIIAAIIVLAAFAVVFGIPTLVIALALHWLGVGLATIKSLGLVLIPLALVAVLVLIAFFTLSVYTVTLITLPVAVFFRFYSLLFLDKITPEHGVLGVGEESGRPPDSEKKTEAKTQESPPSEPSTEGGRGDLYIN